MNHAEKLVVRRRVGFDFLGQAAHQAAAVVLWLGEIAARSPRRNPAKDAWMQDYPELVWATDKEIRQFAARRGRPQSPELPASATYIRRF